MAVLALLIAACTEDTASTQQDASSDALTADVATVQCKSSDECPAASEPCKVASCSTSGTCGVTNAENGVACGDDNPCMVSAACTNGTCVGVSSCQCAVDADCATLDDGDACNGSLYCDLSGAKPACKTKPSSVVTCDESQDTACRTNICQPATGACVLTPVANGSTCDDGDACTSADACSGGLCQGVPDCACQVDADCAAVDDGNPCNGTLYCDKANGAPACKVNPATIIGCGAADDTVCFATQCDPSDGSCKLGPMPVTTACDIDGSTCSLDHCSDGACTAGPLDSSCTCKVDADCAPFGDSDFCNGVLFCNKASGLCELNPASTVTCPTSSDTACLRNQCAPSSGQCQMTPQPDGAPCDDGWLCSVGEACKAGACVAAQDTCTCKTTQDCEAFEASNACIKLYCDKPAGVCKPNPATKQSCAALGDPQCSTTTCSPQTGKCTLVPKNEGGPCEADGSWCTNLDVCAAGSCKAAKNKCPCKADADCAALDDGNSCNGTLYCELTTGTCLINPATVKTCSGAGEGPCKPQQCDPKDGTCKALPLPDGVTCDSDDFVCTMEACSAGTCKLVGQGCLCWEQSDCAPFEDGNLCNGTLYCNKSGDPPYCAPNPASEVICPAPLPSACTVGVCNPATGACDPVPTNPGGACDDANVCTAGDSCKDGLCAPGKAVTCDDNNPCTDDACAPASGCTNTNNTAACSDGSVCTENDACSDGSCKAGSAKVCNDDNPCTTDSCNSTSGCVFANNTEACDADGSVCTENDVCSGGSCKAGSAKVCNDGNACTNDSCNATSGCVFANNAAPCDDGDACTASDSCKNGLCASGAAVNCDDNNPCTAEFCDTKIGCTAPPLDEQGCGALDFDGFDDRVLMLQVNPTQYPNLTFEAWVYRTVDSTQYQTIVGDDDGGYDRGLVIKSGKVYAWAGKEYDTGLSSTLQTWEHFSVVWTPTEVRVSKNGGAAFVGTSPGISSTVKPAALGAMDSVWRFAFRGRIDEVRLWSVARTATDLQATANCAIVGDKPGLLRSFHFQQGKPGEANPSETKATDSSGQKADGTLVGFALNGVTSNWTQFGAPAGSVSCQ